MSTTKTLTLTVFNAGFAAIMGLMAAMSASAQNYPNRPIRLVVPFPPAGSNDIVGRTVAAALGDRLGKQVVVDNRAGGIRSSAPTSSRTHLLTATRCSSFRLPSQPTPSFTNCRTIP